MPQFQIKPHNRTVLRGQSTQFECKSNGFGQEWSRPDHPSSPLNSSAVGIILDLESVSEEDSGLYRCSIGSGMMQIHEDVYLTVIGELIREREMIERGGREKRERGERERREREERERREREKRERGERGGTRKSESGRDYILVSRCMSVIISGSVSVKSN